MPCWGFAGHTCRVRCGSAGARCNPLASSAGASTWHLSMNLLMCILIIASSHVRESAKGGGVLYRPTRVTTWYQPLHVRWWRQPLRIGSKRAQPGREVRRSTFHASVNGAALARDLSHSRPTHDHSFGKRGEQQRRQTLLAVPTAYPRRHVPAGSTYAAGDAGASVAGTDLALQSGLVQTSSLWASFRLRLQATLSLHFPPL